MERLTLDCPVLSYIGTLASAPSFMLVDVGCSGGIAEAWRQFGSRLRALAIDPDAAEIDALRRQESSPGVEYLAAFAALADDHPFALRQAGQSGIGRTPWNRLSVARSLEATARRAAAAPAASAPAAPSTDARGHEPAPAPVPTIDVPRYLSERGVGSVDFLKIDVDGRDFEILQSFSGALDSLQILGLMLEVNFHGSAADTDHTLHNTDRFMKAHGFELFDLTMRRYSLAALPSRYCHAVPAESEYGRLLQGDAFYARDLGSPEHEELSSRIAPEKLLNLLQIFAVCGLPDCAAEIALRFESRLADLCDIRRALDLLAAQAQPYRLRPLTYREYTGRFEAGHPMFFSERGLARRLRKAAERCLRAWWQLRALVRRERARHSRRSPAS